MTIWTAVVQEGLVALLSWSENSRTFRAAGQRELFHAAALRHRDGVPSIMLIDVETSAAGFSVAVRLKVDA